MRPRAIARAGASATRATAAAAVAEGCTGSVCAAASAPGVTAVLGVTAELGVTAVLGVTAALQAKSACIGRLQLLDFELVTRGLLPQQPLLTTAFEAPSMPLPDQRQVEMEVATRDGAGGAAADGGGRAGKRRAATSVVRPTWR